LLVVVTIVEVWTCIEVAIDELHVAPLLTLVIEVVDAMFDEHVADVVDVELEPEFSETSIGVLVSTSKSVVVSCASHCCRHQLGRHHRRDIVPVIEQLSMK
jgi:hypothetical protein